MRSYDIKANMPVLFRVHNVSCAQHAVNRFNKAIDCGALHLALVTNRERYANAHKITLIDRDCNRTRIAVSVDHRTIDDVVSEVGYLSNVEIENVLDRLVALPPRTYSKVKQILEANS